MKKQSPVGTRCQHSETEKENNCPKFCPWLRQISAILTPTQFLVLLHALSYVLADIRKAFCFWDTSLVVYPQDALCTVNIDQKPQNSFCNCMQVFQKCKHTILAHPSYNTFQTKSPLQKSRRGNWFCYSCANYMKKLHYPLRGEPCHITEAFQLSWAASLLHKLHIHFPHKPATVFLLT